MSGFCYQYYQYEICSRNSVIDFPNLQCGTLLIFRVAIVMHLNYFRLGLSADGAIKAGLNSRKSHRTSVHTFIYIFCSRVRHGVSISWLVCPGARRSSVIASFVVRRAPSSWRSVDCPVWHSRQLWWRRCRFCSPPCIIVTASSHLSRFAHASDTVLPVKLL